MRVLLVLPNDQELKPKVLAIINNISQALEVELQSVKIKQRNDFVFDCDYGPLSGEEVVEAF